MNHESLANDLGSLGHTLLTLTVIQKEYCELQMMIKVHALHPNAIVILLLKFGGDTMAVTEAAAIRMVLEVYNLYCCFKQYYSTEEVDQTHWSIMAHDASAPELSPMEGTG